ADDGRRPVPLFHSDQIAGRLTDRCGTGAPAVVRHQPVPEHRGQVGLQCGNRREPRPMRDPALMMGEKAKTDALSCRGLATAPNMKS
ncbi:hypothetical protein CRENBAI_010868, partial [Crenichthys baileyi]